MPEIFENYKALKNSSENQDYSFYENELQTMSLSPLYGSQGTASVASPMSSSSSPLHGIDYISLNNAKVIGEPHITILEQPVEKFRFRYKSEMVGTHGSLLASSTGTNRRKNVPTIQLHNYSESAVIRCTLVTADECGRRPHVHKLVRRENGIDVEDPHDVPVSPELGYIVAFHGMGIINTGKKNIRDELIRKLRIENLEKIKRKGINRSLNIREEVQIKADAEDYLKCMNLNVVALCFQAFIVDKNNVLMPITDPVYSTSIYNLKCTLTGELKICRIDKHTSSAEGGEEIFILVEKVGKKNIKIKFFELNEDDTEEVWSAYGRFTELDVHHQYAIVFRTPPYKYRNISEPKEVFLQLERPSDAECSEPIKFTYKPSDAVMGRKRQRMSHSSNSAELSKVITNFRENGMDNLTDSFNSDSHQTSKELKKLLSEGCESSVCKDIFAGINLDEYLKYIDNDDGNMLTYDGPSYKENDDDTTFAKNILAEAIKCMKQNPRHIKENVQKLLKDRSTYGDSPLHAALRYGQRDIVKYLLMLISVNADCKTLVNVQNSSGKTPLHYAVLQNQPEITKALLILGADPNRSDEHGFSPLHAAVRIPEASACVDALLSEKMIDIEAYNDAGWTALHLAAEAGSHDAVDLLVRAGANVNNTDMSYGRTALHVAVEGGHKNIIEYLLTKTNIYVNKKNYSGNTALHTAVVYTGERAKELCALLIQYGADPHVQNHNRESDDEDGRTESRVDIKVEVDVDNECSEEAPGQSSFDLAMNKPDILQLLNGRNEGDINTDTVSTKIEVEDDDMKAKCLNDERRTKLAVLLDKTSGWKKLAKHLKLDCFLNTLQHTSSNPALFLLNYIDIQGCLSLMDMGNILRNIGEKEAADYIQEILLQSF